ncbi:hypothetical protein DCW30_09305 [Streptomyces alfalfae]|uniref:Uncharacterized protein n=1 Tax=Streptomyces alfalfae TaxID=1642299 RepID=A0A4Q7EIX9_9ACTN|nr:hypothetical protein [Streptomyces alfalfae]AYA18336.1 hypothetical protein D3X13_20730 [Streptomyces fradiae]QQC89643.1 hypothetical protein I8755_15345 [Streptomyces alfalfae]QUI32083.1 hypothetical protein H9W91_15325 [Streptomyces alfalfae]RXX45318.1 hypothetical protein DCW30_09305 [Streptomyces alfalfae]RZM83956.1 hypothetical protein D4104_32615 [Streptomyces alfalfae]
MDAEQARQVETVLGRLDIPGVVAPEDAENPAGPWRVYDTADPATRRDVTADVLATVAARFPEEEPGSGPMRGFVIPPKDD